MNVAGSQVVVTQHDGACGATVTGVRLAELDDDLFAEVLQAWHRYGVVAFPGQHLSETDQVGFSRRLGALENTTLRDLGTAKKPTTIALANVNKRGELVTDPEHKLNQFLRGNQEWHSDSSFKRISAKASMLAALEVPDEGGETEYTDMRAGYDALDEATRRRLDGLMALHSAAYSQNLAMPDTPLHPDEEHNLPPVPQPLVRIHEPTGRPSLFIGRHAMSIEQLDEAEGRAPAGRATGNGLPAAPHLPAPVGEGGCRAVGHPVHTPPRPPLGHPPSPRHAPHHHRRGPHPGRHQRMGAVAGTVLERRDFRMRRLFCWAGWRGGGWGW